MKVVVKVVVVEFSKDVADELEDKETILHVSKTGATVVNNVPKVVNNRFLPGAGPLLMT